MSASCMVFDVGTPTLTILGVYRPEIDPEIWEQQWKVTGDDDATREHFRTLVLIEAVVDGLTDKFDMGKFGQLQPATEKYPTHMQVGYDEGLLSKDGDVSTAFMEAAHCASRFIFTCSIPLSR